MYYYILALIVILMDQVTKWMIVTKMEYGDHLPVIENFLYITSHRNRGAAWGILEGQLWFFYIVTTIVIIGIIYYMKKLPQTQVLIRVALALMLGGAVGNFIDRLFRKEVVDFINFTNIFSYDYPIFNIADAALVVGVILVIIHTLLDGREKEKN
ncbi:MULTISPECIES: signal peptidase II [Bacillaceae]|uniref:signal peptidase II n=1 Tax=Bacillaceae TaxID=186817 RepID=UPI001BDF44E8|nr:signal peptidase II [Cytobacillus sp. IB215316]MDX8360020.1 signal peptidase II [Cytobacillus sp. IB215316]